MAVHTVTMSNNMTDFSLIGDDPHKNAIQSVLISVQVGSNCMSLAPSCFIGCGSLSGAYVPKNCIDLGDYAFYGCSSLVDLNCLQSNGHKLASIGNHCFDGCSSLSSVYFSLGAPVSRDVKIGSYAFANCTSLKQAVWRDWSYLGERMFAGCTSLTKLSVSNNTNYVHPYALAGMPSVKSVSIPNKVWFMSDGMFADCSSLTAVSVQDKGQTSSWLNMVGANVFSGCGSLTSFTLPRSINALSCLDPAMLSGSSVSRLYCNGLDDSVFATNYTEQVEISNTSYITSFSEWKNVMWTAAESKIPVMVFTNHCDLSDAYQGNCKYCQDLVSVLNSAEWKDYMSSRLSAAYFVYASHASDNALWEAVSQISGNGPFTFDWAEPGVYAKAGGVVMKKDGTQFKYCLAPWSSSYGGSAVLTAMCENMIKFVGSGTVKAQTLNSGISKLGSPLSAVTFVSKQGHEFVCSSDVQIEFTPEVRVDRVTTSNFKYGTWYYNAKQLRAFADENHIPVFVEYSSAGCDPCVYFKKNVYNNSTFQDWVASRPYLFCRIEIESYESFSNERLYPQPYYVDKVWAKEKYGDSPGYIPIMMWYWNREDGTKTFDLSSYHFNPSASGSNPPFSMQELMDMTVEKFSGYSSDPQYAKYSVSSLYSNGGKVIGKYCANIDNDTDGIAFPCTYKKSVSAYEKAFDLSGYSVIQSVTVGEAVQYAPNTYYVYDTTTAQSYHADKYGVIFRVDGSAGTNTVTWIQETQNQYSDDKKEQQYECAKWYDLSSSTADLSTFSAVVKESEQMDYRLVILKTSTGDETCQAFEDDVKKSDAFAAYVALQNTVYFIEAKATGKDFGSGIGKALKDFYTADFRQSQSVHFGAWTDAVPQLIVYQGCASCSTDPNRPAIMKASEIDVAGKSAAEVIALLTAALA